MRIIFRGKNREWHSWFAWHPVFVINGFMFDSMAWWRRVERRWVPPFDDGFGYYQPGSYQYKK